MKCCCSNCGWLEINPSGAMFCGYSDERTWGNESCLAWKDKDELKTNADRIRSMSDEELAEVLHNAGGNWYSEEYWLDWLKHESEEE